MLEFTVKVDLGGGVYINGEFVAQCCYDAEAIGGAIAAWLKEDSDADFEEENFI